MRLPQTESQHQSASGLDTLPDAEILGMLLDGQTRALASLASSLPEIGAGAALMAQTIEAGGRLVYAAAGSSGLMALADAAELSGTFGLAPGQIVILMAGGLPVDARMPGITEDDVADAAHAAAIIRATDLVIALSASGSTPYPLTIALVARQEGARVICISNNATARLFAHADVAICAATPPEVVAGSTRLGAGTAQKAALNMMSTLMGIRLGHVHDGLMVNLVADNTKLHARAVDMIMQIAAVDGGTARDCLQRSGGMVKNAVLMAAGATAERATTLLDDSKGHLRAALARL